MGLFKHIKDVAGTTQEESRQRRDDAEWLEALKALAAQAEPPVPEPQPSPAWPQPEPGLPPPLFPVPPLSPAPPDSTDPPLPGPASPN